MLAYLVTRLSQHADYYFSVSGQNLYFYLNHPIKWIRLVGVVVAIDVYPTRWIIVLDDSSGATLEITCGRRTSNSKQTASILLVDDYKVPESASLSTKGVTATGKDIDLSDMDIGTVVKVKGGIGNFRGQKQMLLERLSIIRTTNEEVLAWGENSAFREEVLDVPWLLCEKDQIQARKQAEGFDRKQKRRDERKRKREYRSRATNKSTASSHIDGERKRQEQELVKHSAVEKEKQNHADKRRMLQRKMREEEFKRLQRQKESMKPTCNSAPKLEEKKEQTQSSDLGASTDTTQQHVYSPHTAAQIKKEEQSKRKRALERLERLQEFERLRRLKVSDSDEQIVAQ